MIGKSACVKVFTVFYLGCLITGLVLFCVSFQVLRINKVALKKSTYTSEVDKNSLYNPGR